MDTTPINATPAPSRRIYKFPVKTGGLLPHVVEPLYVGLDGDGVLSCWGKIDFDELPAGTSLDETPRENCSEFIVVPTGVDMPIKAADVRPSWIGTVVEKNGLVWHVALGPTDEALAAFRARQSEHEANMGQINEMLAKYAQSQRDAGGETDAPATGA